MSVIFETQKAVYSKLTSNAPFMLKVKGVYDHVPELAEFPYVTIGELAANDNSVKGAKGYALEMEVNAYSRASGRKELLEVIEMVRNLLDGQGLAVTGFSHILTSLSSLNTALHKDGVTRHGKMLVRISVR